VVWEAALEKAFTRHHKRYGTRRLRVELQKEGHRVGRAQALTAHGLRYPLTACSTNRLRAARIKSGSAISPILPLASGAWAYLYAFQDSFTR